MHGGGAGGDGGKGAEVLLGEGLELGGGDVLDRIEVVCGQLLGDIREVHLTVTLGEFEGAVDTADEVAHHDIADAFQLLLRDGLLLQAFDFAHDFADGWSGGLGRHFGRDEEDYAVAVDMGLAVDAVGVAFVLANVAHKAGAKIAAQDCAENHELGITGVVPCQGQHSPDAQRGLDCGGH